MSTSGTAGPAGGALLDLARDLAGVQVGRPEFRGELRARLLSLARPATPREGAVRAAGPADPRREAGSAD